MGHQEQAPAGQAGSAADGGMGYGTQQTAGFGQSPVFGGFSAQYQGGGMAPHAPQHPASPYGAGEPNAQGGQPVAWQAMYGMPMMQPGMMGQMGGIPVMQPAMQGQMYGMPMMQPGMMGQMGGMTVMQPAMQGQMYGIPVMQPGMMGQMGGMASSGYAQNAPSPSGQQQAAPGDLNRYGQYLNIFTDMANGKQPELPQIAQLVEQAPGDFWKGLIVGAAVAFLLSSETVRDGASSMFGSLLSAFGAGDPQGNSEGGAQ